MPYYDFKCECGKTFEENLAIVDRDNPIKCECGKDATRQSVSTVNLLGFDKLGRSK
jgi:putative FmdB family regulatory protein